MVRHLIFFLVRVYQCGCITVDYLLLINAFDTYLEHSKNERQNSDFPIQLNIPEKRDKPKETNLNTIPITNLLHCRFRLAAYAGADPASVSVSGSRMRPCECL